MENVVFVFVLNPGSRDMKIKEEIEGAIERVRRVIESNNLGANGVRRVRAVTNVYVYNNYVYLPPLSPPYHLPPVCTYFSTGVLDKTKNLRRPVCVQVLDAGRCRRRLVSAVPRWHAVRKIILNFYN